MDRTCVACQASFQVTDDDLAFLGRVSPVFNGTKIAIPPPTHCPDCRQQRRLAINNERFLYAGKCALCNKSTPTEFPPHCNQTIYCRECWHSDKWDSCDYGRDFDFTRPFFDQWKELKQSSPAQALSLQGTNENAEYMHLAGFGKNCYLIMHADNNEDCMYSYGIKHCTSCLDGFYYLYSELCYDCIDVHHSYGLIGCQECINCGSSAFLRDCTGCRSCFLCVGLKDKEYCFENVQLSKEGYEQKMKEIDLKSYNQYQNCKNRRKELEKDHTFKCTQGHNTENCTGSHLYNCKNVHASFDCEDIENGKYLYQIVIGAKDLYDAYQYGNNFQLSYDNSICGLNSYNLLFCHETHNCINCLYGWYMEDSKNCFGCANVHHRQYCILNKQYTEAEYNELVPRIIEHMKQTGEWGEFLPLTHNFHGYNKTTAQLYYPLTKEQAVARGIFWDEYEPPPPESSQVIDGSALPDNTDDVPDDVLNWAIKCEVTGKLFKLQAQELRLYRQMNVPLPRRCPDQRHIDRFEKRNPRHLWTRDCGGCDKQMQTTYAPERSEKVVCEECYLKEVY